MPGLGVRTAIKILTIVGDGSAFPTAAHLAAYAGLAPVTRRSGTSIKGETRSRGNHALKSALFLSAFASLSDPVSRAYYDRKRAQGKRHNAAIICLARRRTDVLYAMLRDPKPYIPPAPNAAARQRGPTHRRRRRPACPRLARAGAAVDPRAAPSGCTRTRPSPSPSICRIATRVEAGRGRQRARRPRAAGHLRGRAAPGGRGPPAQRRRAVRRAVLVLARGSDVQALVRIDDPADA